VDHSIFRAFNKGALGMLKVEGEDAAKIYSGKQEEGIYNPEGGTIQEMPGEAAAPATAANLEQQIEMGANIYSTTCFACHQAKGEGLGAAFPPLANSDYLNADVDRAIDIVLHGKTGEIEVNGKKYNSVMTSQTLNDEEVANVLTYIYSQWGNNNTVVTPEMVKKAR
jgi:nitrite reductase (NO-forming)